MHELVSAVLIVVGAFFMLVAAIGIVRMPDLYLRMSATSKAATLGGGLVLLATAFYFNELGVTSRALAAIAFLLFTAPIAAHVIGRAAYLTGVPLWERTACDELRERYDRNTHVLASSADFLNPATGEKRAEE